MKIKLLHILVFTILSCNSYGQLPNNKSYYSKFRKDIKDTYWFFSAGFVNPTGTWADSPSVDKPLLDSFIGEDGMGSDNGFIASIGKKGAWLSNEFIPSVAQNKDRLYTGWMWELAYANMGTPNWSEIFPNATYTGATEMNFKLGFTINQNIKNIVVIEAYGGLNFIVHITTPSITRNIEDSVSDNFEIVLDTGFATTTSRDFALIPFYGISFRTKWCSLFIEIYNRKYQNPYELKDYFAGENNERYTYFNAVFNISAITYGISFNL